MCMILCVRMMFVYMCICLNSAHLRPELQTVLYTHQALAPGTVASDCSHCNVARWRPQRTRLCSAERLSPTSPVSDK